MQTLRLRSGFSLAKLNKYFVRNVTVNSSITDNVETAQNLKSWKEIPGPKSWPIVGPLPNFLPGGSFYNAKGVELSDELYKRYGSIVKLDGILGSPTMICLFDANAVEYVLRSENTMPIRPGFQSLEYYRKEYNKTYDPHRQTGLISDHGENWKDFRSKVNPIMMQPKTIKLYSDVLAEVADDVISRMRSIRDEKNMIKNKFDVEMNLWALESIGVVALGTRLNCFDPNLPENSEARKLIQNVHDFFAIAEKVDFGASPWRYVSTPNFRKAMKIYQEQESLTKFFIDKAKIKLEESKKNENSVSNNEKPILEKLLEIDAQVAQIMASDMLMAGVDTAATTATGTFYLLAKNPEKQDKLREEILAKQDKQSYLKACIKESMRLLPVVNGNLRKTTKEYNLLGYKIPEDMMLVFFHQSMSLMEEHYPKPKEFIPERWLTEKDDPLHHSHAHPFATASFGFGVRMCIGRRIAELEMQIFISKVVENFQIGWEGPPLKIAPTSLNYITGPFNFIFKDV
ncbi:cytochrome P450 CYP12A2-like isoform X1 [Choristoneura fumiferana]|uniref:cytochrome P450 CYP12A2-like isoform X1 n=2 Tax=Choristoneura fumiferana TaxID=7141 RepID=UPI003D159FA7